MGKDADAGRCAVSSKLGVFPAECPGCGAQEAGTKAGVNRTHPYFALTLSAAQRTRPSES